MHQTNICDRTFLPGGRVNFSKPWKRKPHYNICVPLFVFTKQFCFVATVATNGPNYGGGVGVLLSPAAAQRWRAHGEVANFACTHAMSVDLPLPDGTVATLVVYRWPPLRRGSERDAASLARRSTMVTSGRLGICRLVTRRADT